MNFAFFESLTSAEAEKYLRSFLSEGSRGVEELAVQVKPHGLVVNYAIETITPLIHWVLPQLRTVPQSVDPTLRDWIRQTKSYTANLFEFTEPARILILWTAYYLGESFVRGFSQLKWGIGDDNFAQSHMPVVQGFKHGLEMAPLLVAENLYGRMIAEPSDTECVNVAVQSWSRNVEV